MENSINKTAKFNQTMNFKQVTNFFQEKGLFSYYVDLMFDIIRVEQNETVIDIDVLSNRLSKEKNLINELKCSVVTSIKQL